MRSTRLIVLAGLTVLAVAACSSGEQPGWTYAPAPSPTPTPAASTSASPAASAGASASPGASIGASAAPSASTSASGGPGQTVDELTAQGFKFDKATIAAPADKDFQIKFTNNDAGVPHNVAIKDASGTVVFTGDIFNGVDSRTYSVKALAAGTYQFLCQVHTSMVGSLTVGG